MNAKHSKVTMTEAHKVEGNIIGLRCDLGMVESAFKALYRGEGGGHWQDAPMNWERFAKLCDEIRNNDLKKMAAYARAKARAEKKG